jgi:hypothetical protein
MVVDTGAPVSAIDPAVAKDLGVAERRIMEGFFYNLAGEPFTYMALPHDFAIGDMRSKQQMLMVWPSAMSRDGAIGGAIAADLLRHYDVDIDFGAHKLNIFSQDHCPGKVVYWTSENVAVVPAHVINTGHVIVPVTLDGQSFNAMLDTGASSTFLSEKAAYSTFGLGAHSPDMIKVSDHGGPGGVPLYRHTFKSLVLEGIAIGNPTVSIFDNMLQSRKNMAPHLGSRFGSVAGEQYELTLGLNELRHFHLYIAYKEQKLYITPAPPTAAAGAAAAAAPAPPAGSSASH